MQPFKFSLETVLKYRSEIEESAKIEYQNAQKNVTDAQIAVDEVKGEINHLIIRIDSGVYNEILDINSAFEYKGSLRSRLIKRESDLKVATIKAKKAQNRLIEAKKELQILEKLKDKKMTEYQKEVLLNELKQLDEFIVMSHGRKQR